MSDGLQEADDAATVEELLGLLVSILASVRRLPRAPERDAALRQIREFQTRVGVVLLERFYDKE
ncbi:hypothetical protein [Bradyrhizobium cenepequi]|uniref:hypothetical protein n=1 Tax=Bradyrhizobium cenepequi TaxID=2821403 RepID=UPI001CE3B153|nr:hypothetical protein [Bradyrhizobium cenepequi]MCA6108569.1 hypothetical protein [Bradyrhizobium cenepequi]